MNLGGLTDQELLVSLQEVCADSRRLLARLLVHLNELEARRLAEKAAYPSLYEFCIRELGMSDGEACRRIGAARLIKRFPSLLVRVESGALNLTTLYLLREVLTEANVERVAAMASGKTKREVEELVGRLAPKSDVLPMIIALPSSTSAAPATTQQSVSASAGPVARIAPLSAERYEVRFTAGQSLRDKIDRATELLRHRHPDGQLEAVVERAFDALLARLEKEIFAKSDRPQKDPKPAKSSTVTRAARRQTFARDAERCAFVSPDGRRCTARGHLEIEHKDPRALGGASTTNNLEVLCRAHNRLRAEEVYGKAYIDEKIREHQSKRRMAREQATQSTSPQHVSGEQANAMTSTATTPPRQHGWPPPLEQANATTSTAATPPRQHGWQQLVAMAKSGLVHLGFRPADATRVLDALANSYASTPTIEALLRDALAALTPSISKVSRPAELPHR